MVGVGRQVADLEHVRSRLALELVETRQRDENDAAPGRLHFSNDLSQVGKERRHETIEGGELARVRIGMLRPLVRRQRRIAAAAEQRRYGARDPANQTQGRERRWTEDRLLIEEPGPPEIHGRDLRTER